MKELRDYILRKLTLLQYCNGVKKYKFFKEYLKKYANFEKNEDETNDIIPLPKFEEYYNTILKFLLSESQNISVVDEFFNSDIKIINEVFNVKEIPENDVIMICLIKNDLERVKQFITYYRNIGIQYFAFIDNTSNDGTYEFLIQQPDVNLYSTNMEYTTARREGIMNRMYSYIGFNKWILCVDSDEKFYYVDCERHSIKEFIAKLEENKIKRARSFLLDMYSEDFIFKGNETEEDTLDKYCYFDTNSYEYTSTYKCKMITGGPRKRVFSDEDTVLNCTLSKYPLFFYEKGDFQGSSHWQYPYNKNFSRDLVSVLCHYKFMKKDMDKYKQRVLKNNYAGNSLEYKRYFEILKRGENVSFYNNFSYKLKDSKDLLKIKVCKDKIKNLFK